MGTLVYAYMIGVYGVTFVCYAILEDQLGQNGIV